MLNNRPDKISGTPWPIRVAVLAIEMLTWPLAWLPACLGLALGALGGRLVFRMSAGRRRIALSNIEMIKCNGYLSANLDSQSVARDSFSNLGRSAWEVICFYHRGLKPFIKYIHIEAGEDYLMQAMAGGKLHKRGLMLTTAHLGNWELLCHFLAHTFDMQLTIVGRDSGNRVMDELVRRLRTKGGNDYSSKIGAAKVIIKSLKQGRVVGILIDQAVITGHAGAMISFMGREATTNLAPMRLARRVDAILGQVLFRRCGRHHYITINPMLTPSSQSTDEQIAHDDAQQLNQWLGEYVKKYPDQWMWGHRRWKTKAGVNKDSRSIV